jgi:hypothetical protein
MAILKGIRKNLKTSRPRTNFFRQNILSLSREPVPLKFQHYFFRSYQELQCELKNSRRFEKDKKVVQVVRLYHYVHMCHFLTYLSLQMRE